MAKRAKRPPPNVGRTGAARGGKPRRKDNDTVFEETMRRMTQSVNESFLITKAIMAKDKKRLAEDESMTDEELDTIMARQLAIQKGQTQAMQMFGKGVMEYSKGMSTLGDTAETAAAKPAEADTEADGAALLAALERGAA